MQYFDDDGTEINPEFIPKPSLCILCKNDNDPEKLFLCNLTRMDQADEEEFVCDAYEPLE